jgi:glycerophosphoryl diester phosphodiesterase
MKRHFRICSYLFMTCLMGCSSVIEYDLQGHRGARGLLPENSIPGFLQALEYGVDTIEMDVVVSADSQVVVSHEPWMSAEICSHPDGTAVGEEEAMSLNLFTMSYERIALFDCGSRGNERFPEQEPMSVAKPLLMDALRAVETAAETPVRYNIEIKSREDGDGVFHPDVDTFAHLVHEVIVKLDVMGRTTIQSFDPRALESYHRIAPEATLALLVSNERGFQGNMDRLSFPPQIYSPNHNLVDRALVDSVHSAGLTIVPWTINETARMRELLDLGVDGLITDYPDRAVAMQN